MTTNATLFNTSYDYDGANNVTFRTNNMTRYANSYLYDELHRLTQAKVEGTFVQECQGTEVVAEADFDEDASMHAVDSSEYEVKLDYNGNSVGVEFLNATKVVRVEVKHFTGYVSELQHRIIKDGISVLKSTNNYVYTEVDRELWNLTLDIFGNLVITFNEPQEVRYLKIHSRYEERDENNAILDKATFSNYLGDMVKVYQQEDEGLLNYKYDSVGNRMEKWQTVGVNTEVIYYHYDNGGTRGNGRRLLYETKRGVDGFEENLRGYRYDANGNMVAKSNRFAMTGGTVTLVQQGLGVEYWEYEYDVQNRLVKVWKNWVVVAEYSYDVGGLRILAQVTEKVTHYVYGYGGSVLHEVNMGDMIETRNYIFANNIMIAEIKVTNCCEQEIYYYHHDNLGSTRLITTNLGVEMVQVDYLPFGGDFGLKSEVKNSCRKILYTGQYQEFELGLYYYKARFYDSTIGRFISEDVYQGDFHPFTQHPYIYVLQNPLKYIDPSGMFVRVRDQELKDYLIEEYGGKIDQIRLQEEGILHFDENLIDDSIRADKLYLASINEERNYEYMRVEEHLRLQEYKPEHYQVFRDARLLFLKHFARVQYYKYSLKSPSYVNKGDAIEQYTDAKAFQKIADYAVYLNSYFTEHGLGAGQVLDDLLLTIGSSKYSLNKKGLLRSF